MRFRAIQDVSRLGEAPAGLVGSELFAVHPQSVWGQWGAGLSRGGVWELQLLL